MRKYKNHLGVVSLLIILCLPLGCSGTLETCKEALTKSDCVAGRFNDFFCSWGKKDSSSENETCNVDLNEADRFCKVAILRKNDEATCTAAQGKDFDCVYIKQGIQAPTALCKAAIKEEKSEKQEKPASR